MTAPERKMKHFNANAPRCKAHSDRPTVQYDGTHFITCAKGCLMIDAEHAEPDALMLRWDERNR